MSAQDMDLSRAVWRKSSRSNNGGACIEVAPMARIVAVRDSKDPDGPKLVINPAVWRAFTGQIREGRLG